MEAVRSFSQPEEAIQRRVREIHQDLLAHSHYIGESDFTRIHTEDIQFLFRAYDERFCGGLCQRALDGRRITFRLSQRMTRTGGTTTRTRTIGRGVLIVDAFNGNVCADSRFPSTLQADSAIGRFAEAGSRFGPLWWWSNAACAHWPVNEDRYTGPWRTRTSAPVLVVGNFFDGVTSYAGAQASNRLLEGSRLLSYAGWGHTAYGRSVCVTGHVNAYLLNGTLPPEGTLCPANPNPFLAAATIQAQNQPVAGFPAAWPAR